jgi:hypothetical protein
MSSRPTFAPLSGADEAKIVQALANGPGPGVPYQTEVALGRRTLCVNAVRWPESDDARLSYAAAVSRRAEAEPYRLLPVTATGGFDGCHWVAYEVGAAVPLDVERGRQWDAQSCLDLLYDVGQGLDEAAAEGLLPYEIGLGSIFVDPRFGVLIGDLGTAREAFGSPPVEDGAGDTHVPPEVLRGEGAGERSGVYVCGALLYELLAGGPPRPGLLTRLRPDLSDAIDVVMARALARDSLERYASVTELCQSARRALVELPESVAPLEEPATDGGFRFDAIDDDELVFAPAVFADPPPEAEPPAPVEALEPPAPVEALEPPAPAEAPAPPVERPADDSLPFDEEDEVFERAAAPAPFDWEQPPPLAWRFGRPGLVAALLVGALVLGAGLGFFLTREDEEPASTFVEHLGKRGLSITLPAGWVGGIDEGAPLSAYPAADGFSGLTVKFEDAAIPDELKSDPVKLGRLDAWRDTSKAPALIRYLTPSTAGTLDIACEASPGASRLTLRACERAASTLHLGPIRALPLPGVVEEPGVRAAIQRLSAERATARRRLARARRPSGQRDAAAALARVHDRAARRLADVPEAVAIAAAARDTAAAYRRLARTAGTRSSRRWNGARQAVRRREAALSEAIAAEN